MISILKLADEESCMYVKCLAIQVHTHVHCGATNATPGTAYVCSCYIVYLCTRSGWATSSKATPTRMSATKELNHLLSAKVSFERVLSWRACTTKLASRSAPTARRGWEKWVMHGHRGRRVSQGAIYALQAWEACSVSQDKHTRTCTEQQYVLILICTLLSHSFKLI